MTSDAMTNGRAMPDLKARTKDFALRVIRMYSRLPKTTAAQVMGKQVLRSGTSIGANYREADQGRSKAEFVAKMGDSLREIDETVYWLELPAESGMVTAGRMSPLLDEANQLRLIFASIIRKARRGNDAMT
jgi:four helix bundle protein